MVEKTRMRPNRATMTKSPDPSEEEEDPLVACAVCESVIVPANAKLRTILTPQGPVSVWVCKTCERLGRGDQVRKYVMQERKKAGR